MSIIIYHNPDCETSRNVLAMIRNTGDEPTIIEYLKTPPRRAELVAMIQRMGLKPRDLLRRKGTPYEAMGLDTPTLTDDQLIDAMLATPILIQRPIVITPLGIGLCRPSETVLTLLQRPQLKPFVKEDGSPVTLPCRTEAATPMGAWDRLARAVRQKQGHLHQGMAHIDELDQAGVSPVAKCACDVAEPAMGRFERYLTLWVALCIVAGIALGHLAPGAFQVIAAAEVNNVNLPVAVLVWLMIIPMLIKVDFGALHRVAEHWRGIGVTLFINWAVKPFSMAALAWLFIGTLFRHWLPADQIDSYIGGLILLAAAPCTAMVFVWSNLCKGEPHFTLSQVALNDTIMVFAFAPIVGLLLGLSSITVPWDTLVLSVVLYIVVPVIIAQGWRLAVLRHGGEVALARVLSAVQPWSLGALLATLVLLFGFQGEQIVEQPLVIGLLAVPIVIQVYFNAGLAYLLNRWLGVAHCVAGPSALIGASNFFELAVAAAISLFGLQSGAALATVVGVLIEVPVMLTVVRVVNSSRDWYEAKA